MKNIFRAENYIRKPFLLSRSHRTDLYGIGSVFCAKPFYDGMLLHTSLLGISSVDLIYHWAIFSVIMRHSAKLAIYGHL